MRRVGRDFSYVRWVSAVLSLMWISEEKVNFSESWKTSQLNSKMNNIYLCDVHSVKKKNYKNWKHTTSLHLLSEKVSLLQDIHPTFLTHVVLLQGSSWSRAVLHNSKRKEWDRQRKGTEDVIVPVKHFQFLAGQSLFCSLAQMQMFWYSSFMFHMLCLSHILMPLTAELYSDNVFIPIQIASFFGFVKLRWFSISQK